jgi:hypothetical protein
LMHNSINPNLLWMIIVKAKLEPQDQEDDGGARNSKR